MPISDSELSVIVGNVLLQKWDPIGVRDCPDSSTEYQSYVKTVTEMLLAGADQYDLGRHLTKLEHSSMGLRGNPPRCDRAARCLVIAYHCALLSFDMKTLLQSELDNENVVLETSTGSPREDSVFIRLARAVESQTPPAIERRDAAESRPWSVEIYEHKTGHVLAW